jgi:hypothetical protein
MVTFSAIIGCLAVLAAYKSALFTQKSGLVYYIHVRVVADRASL